MERIIMTREEYLAKLFESYSRVSLLSNKNECQVIRARNQNNGQELIVRSYASAIVAYEKLYEINCENLPTVFDVIDLEDGQIVLEEYIDGVTVAQVMETGSYRYAGAKKVLRSVCSALTVLHGLGIVHRDVKPENIIIDKKGRVVLIDFNASRVVKPCGKDTVVMGTVGYASPEQLGVSQSDERTDVYSAGILLNVMLTGKHPAEEIAKGRGGRIVKKCTNINPYDRYDSAEKLAKAL